MISRESRILVPEGETVLQNGHAHEKTEHNDVGDVPVNNNNENSDQQVINVSHSVVVNNPEHTILSAQLDTV